MESKESAETTKKSGSMRLPSEGNTLWEMYHKLPRMVQRELKETINSHSFTFTTFLRDTDQGRSLDLVPFGRLDFYCAFFVQHGFDNLFDVARQERATQAEQLACAALV